MRIRKRAAIALTIGALALFWFDYWKSGGLLILPTILGINMIIIAARLIQLNASHAHAERRAPREAGAAGVGHADRAAGHEACVVPWSSRIPDSFLTGLVSQSVRMRSVTARLVGGFSPRPSVCSIS